MGARTSKRTIDRDRRQRILDAALTVVGRDGVEGLSHRRVAMEANVPISAACYYFESIENLLLCAMREAADRDLTALRDLFARANPSREELPALLAGHLLDQAQEERLLQVTVVELYVAALRRPELRELGEGWNETWSELVAPIVGPVAARSLMYASAGVMQQILLDDIPPDSEDVAQVLGASLGLAMDRAATAASEAAG